MMTPDERFEQLRCGVFIHWGLYAIPGGIWRGEEVSYIGEWIQSHCRIPNAEYAQLAGQFDPALFDAEKWMKMIADAGFRYIVFTAKHHDGFAMYKSKVSPFNIVDATPFGRDVLAEISAACQKYGVKLGIYYSHYLDWHEFDGGDPGPLYPKNYQGMSWGNDWDFPDCGKKDFECYFEGKVLPQIRELLTNYGEVVELWCDCPLDIAPKYSEKLRDLVRELQPDCRINSRIGNGCGDFQSLGDNQVMRCRQTRPCESPITLNHTWGFKYGDEDWKPAQLIAERMVFLASRNANLLVNIGPRPEGDFPDGTVKILKELARWQQTLPPDVISGSEPGVFPSGFDWGCTTTSGDTLNFFLTQKREKIEISGIFNRVVSADVPFEQKDSTLTLHTENIAQTLLPLIRVKLDGIPRVAPELCPQDGVLALPPSLGRIIEGGNTGKSSSTLGVDGVALDDTGHMTLAVDGTLRNWENPGDRIVWDAFFPQGGRYQIEVVTFMAYHARPWCGGRTVEILLDGKSVAQKYLTPDRMLENGTHPSAATVLGEIGIPSGAKAEIALRVTSIDRAEVKMMNLVEVRFQKQRDF
ncbi:MAG: alpha-L-fucosidase [Victivallaceae bacterium]|nr:alpha-L-fucosidase [Victivallaceae bacterium]